MQASVLKAVPGQNSRAECLLARRFLAKRKQTCGAIIPLEDASPDMESVLVDFVAKARGLWPKFGITDESFIEYLAAHLRTDVPVEQALRNLSADDLWLVHACLQEDNVALREFEIVLKYVSRKVGVDSELSFDGRDDLLQQLRSSLLVSKDGSKPPLLDSYAGRGSLKGWLQVVLRREKMRAQKPRRETTELSSMVEQTFLVEERDPETRALHLQHQVILKEVFRAAVERLEPDSRLLLVMWIVEDMTQEQMGKVIGAHRMTIGRYIDRLCRQLLFNLHLEMNRRVKLRRCDVESLMRAIANQMEASLSVLASKHREAIRRGFCKEGKR